MRTAVIINPVAGSAGDLAELVRLLGDLPGVRVLLTTRGGEGEVLAREAVAQGANRVVAAGGDGTVNDVLNGIAAAIDRVEMAILPLGTGNDFAASIGMRLPMTEAAEAVVRWQTRAVDVVRVRARGPGSGKAVERLMLNASSGGFVQAVGASTDQGSKRGILGPLSYFLNAAMSLPELKEYEISIGGDAGEETFAGVACMVFNGRALGGGVIVNPDGQVDDGRVEVIAVKAGTLGDLALAGMALVGGSAGRGPEAGATGEGEGERTGSRNELLVFSQGSRVEVRAEPPMLVNVDGEVLGETPVVYEVWPRALRMVVGAGPNGERM
jgi:diacylglycerol kinase (ATP)